MIPWSQRSRRMRQALFDKLKRAFLVSLIILSVFGCAKEDPYTRMMWLEDLATSSGIYQDDVVGDMYAFGAIKDIDDLERELDIDYVAYTASNLSEKEFEGVKVLDLDQSDHPDELIEAVSLKIIELDDQKAHPKAKVSKEEALVYIEKILDIIDNKTFEDKALIEYKEDTTYQEKLPEPINGYYPITQDLDIGAYIVDQEDEMIYEVIEESEEGYGLKEVPFEEAIEKIDIQGTIEDLDLAEAEIIIDGELEETPSIYHQEGITRMAKFSPSGEFKKDGYKITYSISLNKLHLHVSKKTERGINVYFDGDIYGITPSYKWDYEDGKIKDAYLKVDFKTGEEFGLSVGRYKTLYGDIASLDKGDLFNSLKNFMKPEEDLLSTSFTLMKIKVPISGVPIATFDIEVKLNFYISGKVEVALATDNALGLEIKNNHLRMIFDHDEDLDFNVNASANSTLSVIFSLHLIKDLVDLRFNGGIKGLVGTTVHMYDSDGRLMTSSSTGEYDALSEVSDQKEVFVCGDISLSWILNIELNSDKTLAYLLGFHKKITILDEDDQIFLDKSHIENGLFVEKCSYKDRKVTSNKDPIIVNEDRISLDSYAMVIRNKEQIKIKSLPSGYTNKDIIFAIEDASIASVDQSGNITPLKSGTTKVRIYTSDEKYEIYINILVSIDETLSITI